MFDIGWTEMTVIVILAIIVIGPKDLPKVLRTLGRWLRKARGLAREFQKSLDEVMSETEIDELKKQVESAAQLDPVREAEKVIDPGGEIGRTLADDKPGAAGAPAPKAAPGPEGDLRDQLDAPAKGPGAAAETDLRAQLDSAKAGPGADLRDQLGAPKRPASGTGSGSDSGRSDSGRSDSGR